VKTPHRDGRKAKLTHTPSMKAEQLSRHRCNQILRGRYQHAKNKNNKNARVPEGNTSKEHKTTKETEGSTDKI